MKKQLIGINVGKLSNVYKIYDKLKGFDLLQIQLGDGNTFEITEEEIKKLHMLKDRFKVIIQSPNLVNLVNRGDTHFDLTLQYMREVVKLDRVGVVGYVTYLGRLYNNDLNGSVPTILQGNDSFNFALQQIIPYFERHNVDLYIENSASLSDADMASISYIIGKNHRFKSKRLKLCLDTAKGYAYNEYSVRNIGFLNAFRNEMGLIHLNTIDEGVSCGSGINRHSKSNFNTCTVFSLEDYKQFILNNPKIPIIVERGSLSFALEDLKFIKNVLKADNDEKSSNSQ